jgi:hypothetical protein
MSPKRKPPARASGPKAPPRVSTTKSAVRSQVRPGPDNHQPVAAQAGDMSPRRRSGNDRVRPVTVIREQPLTGKLTPPAPFKQPPAPPRPRVRLPRYAEE